MLQDAVFTHQELAAEMRKICSAKPRDGDPHPFITHQAVPVGTDPRMMPGFRQTTQSCLPAWVAAVAFGNRQRKLLERMEKQPGAEPVQKVVAIRAPETEQLVSATVEPTEVDFVIDDEIIGAMEALSLAA